MFHSAQFAKGAMFTSRFVLSSAALLFVFSVCGTKSPPFIFGQIKSSENNSRNGIIWITAHNKNGDALSASDLEVKLDGKPTPVSQVRPVSAALHYCLLIDISGSTRSARSRQLEEAVALLSKIPRAGHDYGLLVTFNNQAYLDAEGTDPQELIRRISQDSRGATALYDAIVACSDYLSKKDLPQDGSDTLNVIFLLSDGIDNSSRTTAGDAERTLLTRAIRVYSIGEESEGSNTPDQISSARKSLRRMVGATGGKEYSVNKRMPVDQIVQDISSDLGGLYTVSLGSEKDLSIGHVYKLEVRCRQADCAVTAPREYLFSHDL